MYEYVYNYTHVYTFVLWNLFVLNYFNEPHKLHNSVSTTSLTGESEDLSLPTIVMDLRSRPWPTRGGTGGVTEAVVVPRDDGP